MRSSHSTVNRKDVNTKRHGLCNFPMLHPWMYVKRLPWRNSGTIVSHSYIILQNHTKVLFSFGKSARFSFRTKMLPFWFSICEMSSDVWSLRISADFDASTDHHPRGSTRQPSKRKSFGGGRKYDRCHYLLLRKHEEPHARRPPFPASFQGRKCRPRIRTHRHTKSMEPLEA